MINTIIKGAITIALAIGSLFTPTADLNVGGDGFKFVAGSTYYLSGSGIDTDDTSITLTSFKMPVSDLELAMSDFGDIGYATIEPGKSKKEFISFTGITQDGSSNKATLTGVTRGLSFVSPYTASTTLAQNHSGGAKLIISNPPQLYNKATFKDNEETINKVWTFDADNMPVSDADVNATSSRQFATKFYVDNVSFQGAATSTESSGGIVELATEVEVASTTASTSNKPLVIQAQNATSTPTYSCDSSGTTGALCIPVAENDGDIANEFIGQDQDYTWTGGHIFGNSTTTNATTTNMEISGNLSFGGSIVNPKFGGDGSDGALSTGAATTTIDLANARIVEKNYTSITIPVGGGLAFQNPHAEGSVIILRSQGDVTIAGVIDLDSMGGDGGDARLSAAAGQNGTDSADILDDDIHYGLGGLQNSVGTPGASVAGGLKFSNSTAARATPYATTTEYFYRRIITLQPGGGGGSGATNHNNYDSGNAGNGGGALLMEIRGAMDFSGSITANGDDAVEAGNKDCGPSGSACPGGSGGGGGGMIVVLYNTLTANTGATIVNGGNGADGGNATDGATYGGCSGGSGGGSIGGAGGASGAGGAVNAAGSNGSAGTCNKSGASAGTGGTGGTTDGSSSGGGGGGGGGACGSSLIAKNEWFY